MNKMAVIKLEKYSIEIPERDQDILRRLAEDIAELAGDPVNRERRELWRRINDLDQDRPAVLIRRSEVPWHEIQDESLIPETSHDFTRTMESEFRQILYQWKHFPCDMVVGDILESHPIVVDSGIGLSIHSHTIQQGEGNEIYAHQFEPQIKDESDIEKIALPQVTCMDELSEEFFQLRKQLLGDILRVEKRGYKFVYTAFWDELVRLWGPEQALLDLVVRPELVHAAMERLTAAWLARLDQYEKLGLLSYDEGNYDCGSGGLAFTKDLPSEGFDPDRVRAVDQWGFNTPQIFTDVSPDMHEEFALRYERRWLERFGLTYYGCCEKLHHKIHLLRTIPNLRKISISPFADVEKSAEQIGGDYVMSIKPNPAFLAYETWNPEEVRQDLENSLKKSDGCSVEFILKDISTIRYEPHRLKEWANIAMELVAKNS